MTGCDLNNGHITEQSEALEKMGAERPEVLVRNKVTSSTSIRTVSLFKASY